MNSKSLRERAHRLPVEERARRLDELGGEINRLLRFEQLTAAQEERLEEMRREIEHIEGVERRDWLQELFRSGKIHDELRAGRIRLEYGTDAGVGGDDLGIGERPSTARTATRDAALRAIESSARARDLFVGDAIAHRTTELVERDSDPRGGIAAWARVAASPHYARAFSKILADPISGGHSFTGEEREAWQAGASLTRAMSLTDAAGGYLVPFHLDPTIVITSTDVVGDWRQFCRTVTIASDVWNGVSSAGITASWDAEAAEVSDDSPTLAQPAISAFKAQAFVPFSFEVGDDAPGLLTELQRLLLDAKVTLEGAAFATGSGNGQPTGIVTALTGGASVVNSAGADTLALTDVYALKRALPARHQAGASWLASGPVYDLIRQFDTAGSAALGATLGEDLPAALLGKPTHEASTLDATIDAGQENYVLAYGDFSNYVIVDRVGLTVSLVPHLFGANRRPTGQRGLHAYWRVGADSVNDDGFRLLNVT